MTMQFSDLAAAIADDGTITPQEIVALRRLCWADGAISPVEAEVILALDARLAAPEREWVDFCVEAVVAMLVEQQDPRGTIDPNQAHWLTTRLGTNDSLSAAGLEMLVHLLEKAVSAPPELRQFALARIEAALLKGRDPACVTGADARLLRRLIFAGPTGVSRAEADLLFRIKDATLGADNAPEWQPLFVQGVANYLQGFSGFEAPSRERAAELERFMAAPASGLGSFLARIGHRAAPPVDLRAEHLGQSRPGWLAPDDDELLGHDLEAAARDAAVISADESTWLEKKIAADGQTDPLEQALQDFLRQA